jgi:hypothetical protein
MSAGCAAIFAGVRWIMKTVKDASFDSGKHDSKHEEITIQIDAAHDKIRKHDERITKVETAESALAAKIDTMLANQQTMLGVLMDQK